ncbi:site-specific DNA-methyltransferase [uncultured Bacteroides sp.]|uniref:site-specific DNA-methyltransferase n=1 Tax=uncultured Bacteroides sp. TaxID=162156 RepID=UPI0025995F50|nr:site-specific DNA-methyltransferase [uncultured Bacteroides sp.]
MDGYSQTPQKERLETLRLLMPEVFDEGYIDWEKLKVALGENVNFSNERYVLNWAGKSEAFRVMQQPSTATLVPCREESVDFDNTQNVFIEGENMEVLKVLQRSYFRKVKMIYIDPPYNTGSDSFIYPDKFSENKEEYLRRVGDKNEEGYMTRDGMFRKNAKENGQYHSNWLNMMMPRLYLAKNLLREDGVIFISIDDNEVYNLRMLMNEIFGEENFVAQFIWHAKKGGGSDSSKIVTDQEYVLCYLKSDNPAGALQKVELVGETLDKQDEKGSYRRGRELNKWGSNSRREDRPTMYFPIKGPNGKEVYPIRNDGSEGCWRWGRKAMKAIVEAGDVEFVERQDGTYIAYEKIRNTDARFKPYRTFINCGTTADGSKLIKSIFGAKYFDFPKPLDLITILANIGLGENDILLDFFSGSGTTAHAVMELNKDGGNRKFICVQLPELCEEKSEAYKGGYKTIAEISKERIRRAGAKIRKEVEMEQAKQKEQQSFDEGQTVTMPDLGVKVFKLSDSNFKQWRDIKGSDKEEWQQQILDFLDPVTENATINNMVYELLLKSGKDLNSVIEQKEGYYLINSNELILMLESATQDVVNSVLAEHPDKVIALDRLFEGNDQLKTNTVLQMRDAGIEFKTI